MIFGMETNGLPPNWTPLEAVAVIKCLDEEGEVRLALSATNAISQWEAVGMLTAAIDVSRSLLTSAFVVDEEGEAGG